MCVCTTVVRGILSWLFSRLNKSIKMLFLHFCAMPAKCLNINTNNTFHIVLIFLFFFQVRGFLLLLNRGIFVLINFFQVALYSKKNRIFI